MERGLQQKSMGGSLRKGYEKQSYIGICQGEHQPRQKTGNAHSP